MNDTLTTSNSPDLETLKEWDRLHQIHPWAAIDSWRGYDNMFVDSADGIYFWDGAGKRYIDGPGGMWCVLKLLLGRRRSLLKPYIDRKMDRRLTY